MESLTGCPMRNVLVSIALFLVVPLLIAFQVSITHRQELLFEAFIQRG